MGQKIKNLFILLFILALSGCNFESSQKELGKPSVLPTVDIEKLSKEVKGKYEVANNILELKTIKNAEKTREGELKDEIKVVIGDKEKTDKFYPKIELQRWSDEVSFSLKLKGADFDNAEFKTDKDKIIWENGKEKIEFYNYIDDEGGYKMVWFLKEKPATNKLEFEIQSKGLDFFYQPELTQEEKDEGASQPENAIGSYAVYHSTKGGMNDSGGKDYKVGKAFHIYRPHIIDAEGKETWGILHIGNGIYSVTIPQDFLDKAIYPVRSNDTFGYESAGLSQSQLKDYRRGNYYSVSKTGTLDSVHSYLRSNVGTYNAKVFVNTKDGSGANSHTQIATKENTGITTTEEWKTFTLNNESISITDHILSITGTDNGMVKVDYIIWDGSNHTYYSETQTYESPESPWNVVLSTPYYSERPEWTISTEYSADNEDRVTNNDWKIYSCLQNHTSSANNEPGVGVDWESYWERNNVSIERLSIYATYTPSAEETPAPIQRQELFFFE